MRPTYICLVLLVGFASIDSTNSQKKFQLANWFDEKVLSPAQSTIHNAIKTQKRAMQAILNIDPDTKFSNVFTNISSFNLTQIKECYDMTIGDEEFNIFENTIFDGIAMYYKHFNENFKLATFPTKAKNLLTSFGEIGTQTVKCITDPTEYKVGLNQLGDWNSEAFKGLFGGKFNENEMDSILSNYASRRLSRTNETEDDNEEETDDNTSSIQPSGILNNTETTTIGVSETTLPRNTATAITTSKPEITTRKTIFSGLNLAPAPTTSPSSVSTTAKSNGLSSLFKSKEKPNEANTESNNRQKRAITVDPKCFVRNKSNLQTKFDWNAQGKVTPARYQGECGSCWAFASLSSLESVYLIKGKSTNKNLDLSEQQLLNCARKDGCKGGTAVDAFNYLLENRGIAGEKSLPYEFKENNCASKAAKRSARIKDYCLRGIYAKVNNKTEQLNDQEIQLIIRDFGPVYATMFADDKALKNYKSGVERNPQRSKVTNHAITIVGWDANSWIIKNSWGRGWGQGGFFRMKRGLNMCGLNTYVTYPIV